MFHRFTFLICMQSSSQVKLHIRTLCLQFTQTHLHKSYLFFYSSSFRYFLPIFFSSHSSSSAFSHPSTPFFFKCLYSVQGDGRHGVFCDTCLILTSVECSVNSTFPLVCLLFSYFYYIFFLSLSRGRYMSATYDVGPFSIFSLILL